MLNWIEFNFFFTEYLITYSCEITKLKEPHTCVSTFVQKDHHQLNPNFIVDVISTIVMNNF